MESKSRHPCSPDLGSQCLEVSLGDSLWGLGDECFPDGCGYRRRKGVMLVEQEGQTGNNHGDEMSALVQITV